MSEHFERAMLLIGQRRFADAEAELRRDLSADTDRALALSMLALAELEQDKVKDAERTSGQAIAEDPERADCYHVRSLVLFHQEDVKGAEEAIRVALGIDPDKATYYAQLAQVLLERGRAEEALSAVDRGLELDAESVDLRQTRTVVLFKLRNMDAAQGEAEAAAGLDPEDPSSLSYLGMLALQRNDTDTARSHFQEALRIDAEHEGAKAGLVQTIKAKNVVFRWFMAFGNWMSSLDSKVRWGVIIGAYVLYRILRSAARENPAIQPVVYPILGCYLFFVYLTWTIDPLTNLVLRLSPVGRTALSEDEIRASNWVGLSLALAIVSLVAVPLGGPGWLLLDGILFAVLVVPISGAYSVEGRARRILGSYAIVLSLLALVSVPLFALGLAEAAALVFFVVLIGSILFTWVGQFFVWR